LFACSSKREEYLILKDLSEEKNDAFWVEVYRQGYKFITYEQNYSDAHLHLAITPNPAHTPNWLTLKPLSSPIYEENGEFQASYQIIVNDPPIAASKTCKKKQGNDWEVVSH
jgi:hypothetical protein